MSEEQDEILEATLADLIVALTEEADRLVQNRRQAHNFVAYFLLNVLSHSAPISHTWH
jgi:Mn-dependent DtxR family transcriptional regulator